MNEAKEACQPVAWAEYPRAELSKAIGSFIDVSTDVDVWAGTEEEVSAGGVPVFYDVLELD